VKMGAITINYVLLEKNKSLTEVIIKLSLTRGNDDHGDDQAEPHVAGVVSEILLEVAQTCALGFYTGYAQTRALCNQPTPRASAAS